VPAVEQHQTAAPILTTTRGRRAIPGYRQGCLLKTGGQMTPSSQCSNNLAWWRTLWCWDAAEMWSITITDSSGLVTHTSTPAGLCKQQQKQEQERDCTRLMPASAGTSTNDHGMLFLRLQISMHSGVCFVDETGLQAQQQLMA